MQLTTLTPVNVLTGFLGSGKNTLLNRWVRQASMQNTLVVINEFGAIGLDHQLITKTARKASPNRAVIQARTAQRCCIDTASIS